MIDRNYADWKVGDMIRWEDNYEGEELHPILAIRHDTPETRGDTWVKYRMFDGDLRTTMSTNLERVK
jgi:hypothetical protein